MTRTTLVCLLFFCAVAASASARTLVTSSSGTDGVTCGATTAPCRSISQAIANAVDGDTINVGPGYYGDLDRDGNWGEPGEELGDTNATCSCVVEVSKRVTLVSRDGAAATVIDANGDDLNVIEVLANGATVGKPNRGFTLRGSPQIGLLAQLIADLHVAGNVAVGNGADGFFVNGDRLVSSGNRSLQNGDDGFTLLGTGGSSTGDVSIGNFDRGFVVQGSNHITRAIALGNQQGFYISGGSGHRLDHSSALGNRNEGIFVFTSVGVAISSVAIVGNDAEGGENCGLTNASGLALRVEKSWWGAATGPGADPADAACESGVGSVTDASGFAKKELRTVPKTAR